MNNLLDNVPWPIVITILILVIAAILLAIAILQPQEIILRLKDFIEINIRK